MMNKLVSIIIPCYNSERTVLETIESALIQTYTNLEIIVVDDGSTDDSLYLVQKKAIDYQNLFIYAKDNEGLPATRNFGFTKSKGDYVVFLDSDDLLSETFVSECMKVIEQDPSLSMVCTQADFFERETGLCVHPEYSFKLLLMKNCFTATALINSKYFKEVGMYDHKLKFAEDWELWIRLLKKYPNTHRIEKTLFHYRKRHSKDSMTDTNIRDSKKKENEATLYIYNKHYDLYSQYGLDMTSLLHSHVDVDKFKNKYYNVWYRKFFYKYLSKKKL